MAAISVRPSLSRFGKVATIDQDECVECGECLKCGVCLVDAHVKPEYEWPRILRYMWSDPMAVFRKTGIAGRGTQEMKTNEISGRFSDGDVGIAVEFGRPGIGSRLYEAEKASKRLAALGVEFEPDSPWTHIIDNKSGEITDPTVRNEKVLSCIVECKAPMERVVNIYEALMEVAEEIDTVFTLNIISKCKDGKILIKPILDEAGINVRINGKDQRGSREAIHSMTHSNHRRGDRESLAGDYLVFTTDARQHDPAKLRKYVEILMSHNPVGLATRRFELEKRIRLRYVRGWDKSKDRGIFESTSMEEMRKMTDLSWGSAIYTSIDDVKGVLRDLKEADLGIAVVFTGLFEKVHEACEEVGTGPHTVNMSAESFGRLDLLPEPRILELTTMCGHHMISPYLVKHLINQVKRGRITSEDASVEMAKQCTCNFFNVERGIKLIEAYSKSK